jgi:replicative DNA helicase
MVLMDGAHRQVNAQTASEVLDSLDERLRRGDAHHLRPVATGFSVLDDVLGGGVRAGELVLLAGPPGVGKTVMALQWARHAARSGQRSIFVCYEHEPSTLLLRLLALELADVGDPDGVGRSHLAALMAGVVEPAGLETTLGTTPAGAAALDRLRTYGDNLTLVRGSGAHTDLAALDAVVTAGTSMQQPSLLFVDYLQKVAMHPEPMLAAEKVIRTVEGIKELALSHAVPVVVLSAVDGAGMAARRGRLHHLRGSSAIAFEADVVLMLNDKEKAVSKVHLTYDTVRAQSFRDWTVVSIEKNRGGPNLVDLEFEKDFAHFRFDPHGGFVTEKLVSERVDEAAL